MSSLRAAVGLALLGLLIFPSAHAEETDTCPYPEGRTIEDLAAALAAHAEWLEKAGWRSPDVPGRANFCNASLPEAQLEGADLTSANLEGTHLGRANLSEANLAGANLEGANLKLANLEGANLSGANLEGANLSNAFLKGADLIAANLEGANLVIADLEDADLEIANLGGANLISANLEGANLLRADLKGADLSMANLQRAVLNQTLLENAKIYRVDLSAALYQPATAPALGYVSGLRGLRSVTVCPGEGSGLVQLRQALKTAGLRELEREATYALESLRTDYALAQWKGKSIKGCEELAKDRVAAVEGLFRLIFFELPTDYGLAYGRPILILLSLIFVFALLYLPALFLVSKQPDHDSGIYRVWPKGRIKEPVAECSGNSGMTGPGGPGRLI